jgi:hypothetical protein
MKILDKLNWCLILDWLNRFDVNTWDNGDNDILVKQSLVLRNHHLTCWL